MNVKTEKRSVYITIPRKEVDAYQGAYFYHKGVEMEDEVQNREVENGLNATFDGFEVLSDFEQVQLLGEAPAEPSITAKLYYYVDSKV